MAEPMAALLSSYEECMVGRHRCGLCRVGIYYQLVSYMKEHFGDDAKGRKKAFYFLPWHFNFLCRYR